jgi:phosphoenolpyruvate carboxylase
MHHQRPGVIHLQITRPVDDEFLGSRVEIALTERRRIDRVEELSQLGDELLLLAPGVEPPAGAARAAGLVLLTVNGVAAGLQNTG